MSITPRMRAARVVRLLHEAQTDDIARDIVEAALVAAVKEERDLTTAVLQRASQMLAPKDTAGAQEILATVADVLSNGQRGDDE